MSEVIRRVGARTTAAPPAGLARFALLALIVTVALGWTLLSLAGAVTSVRESASAGKVDFFTFLDSTAQWRQGLPPYQPIRTVEDAGGVRLVHPNLNHPATIPLLLPFTLLPRPDAFIAWTILNLAAYLAALVVAWRTLRLSSRPGALLLALVLATTAPGAIVNLQLGQWGMLLALPLVLCWRRLRQPWHLTPARQGPAWWCAAGALLGLLIALKPFLLPLAALLLPRPRRWGLPGVALGGGALSLAALPFTGIGGYRDWLAALRTITWYDHPLNIALTGLFARLTGATLPTATGWVLLLLTAALGGALLLTGPTPATPGDADRQIALLLLIALLGSSLGWLYYLPLLIPALLPALARWREPVCGRATCQQRLLLGGAVALLWTPHILLPLLPATLWADLTLRAAPTWGLLLLAIWWWRACERVPSQANSALAT